MNPLPTPLGPGDFVTPSLRLVRNIGSGGMGSVWLADHLTLHTQVVVKFLAAAMAADDTLRTRFSHEAAAASQVKSPHVVQMIDHGVAANGLPFIAMEHLEGETLAERLRREKPLPPAIVAQVVTQTCKALTRAHEKGIVHRDIKPDNIFLCDAHEGEIFVKVLDFGIAKRREQDTNATQTGQAIGTPSFMSPEQLVGSKDVDRRSDLWSLGVLAFVALTGHRPFSGGSIGAAALAIHTQAHPKPTDHNAQLGAAVDAWFSRACAVNVEERFQTARELGDALAEALGMTTSGPRSITAEAVSFSTLKLEPEAPQETNQGPIAQSIAPNSGADATPKGRSKASAVVGVVIVLAASVLFLVLRTATSDHPAPTGNPPAAGAASSASTSVTSVAAPAIEPPTTASARSSEPTAASAAESSSAVTGKPAGLKATGSKATKPASKPAGSPPGAGNPTSGYDDIE